MHFLLEARPEDTEEEKSDRTVEIFQAIAFFRELGACDLFSIYLFYISIEYYFGDNQRERITSNLEC
ncbi:hypothetical protein [Nostoc sp.]|uniref:hypothetical protein n=1 Tax=Nostoc sp. TaxID=1180 RepID=UPI002FF5D48D